VSAGQKIRAFAVLDIKTKGDVIQLTDALGVVLGQWTGPAT
jgi:hypothetical protein